MAILSRPLRAAAAASALLAWAAGAAAPPPQGAAQQLRGATAKPGGAAQPLGNGTIEVVPNTTADEMRELSMGLWSGRYVLHKRFDLAGSPSHEFDVANYPDANLTHSCSNYVDDGSTVFSRDGNLVLRVASHCEGGGCLKSGRVMSKQDFKYGLFTFSARVPKCHYVWPALWLLPNDVNGHGTYGRWPCSGEIDVLETVHDQPFGTFNLVAGYGSTGGCAAEGAKHQCNQCMPEYCTSTTMSGASTKDRYFIEDVKCDTEHPSWTEHTFVLNWQPDVLTTWVDPKFTYDAEGRLVHIRPRDGPTAAGDLPAWRVWEREETPTWLAVQDFMDQCFPGRASSSAPFDDRMKIVLNIAVGGYGGSPCNWGEKTCQTACGGAVGSELIISDISVWEMEWA